jgi:hypothetical protein
LGIKRLLIYGDSLLVVQQVNKEWDINKDTIGAYITEIRKLENKFSGLEIHHVIHDNNVGMDVLSKLGSDQANVPPGVFVHELHHPSIKAPDSSSIAQGPKEPDQEVLMIEVDWRVAFIDYIQEHKLPPGVDPKSAKATRILRRSKGYVQVGGNLYKRGSASGILMKACVETMWLLTHLSARHFNLVFTGRLLWQMPKHASACVPTASYLASSLMLGS